MERREGMSSNGGDIVQLCDEKEGGTQENMVRGERMAMQYRQQPRYVAPQVQGRWHKRVAQELERWIFLYNVTTGLYMLDWWERCIFNVVFLVFFAVAGYNSGHYLQRIGAGLLAWAWWGGESQDALVLGEDGARGLRGG